MDGIDPAAVRELLDREAIRRVLASYCRGIDRVWPELVASVYDSPSVDHHGAFHGSGREFAIDSDLARARHDDTNVMCHHLLGQSLIDFGDDGAEAECETYFWATGVHGPAADRNLYVIAGRYLDRFRKVDQVWRLQARRAVVDISGEAAEPSPWSEAAAYHSGARWPHDAVFDFDRLVSLDREDDATTSP